MAGRKSSNGCSGLVMCRRSAGCLGFVAPACVLILALAVLSFGVAPVHGGDEPGGVLSGDVGSRRQGRFGRGD